MPARTLRAALAAAALAVTAACLLRARPAPAARRGPRGYALKRPLDVCVAAAALVVFAPVMLAAALAIRLTMGAPALFRQTRPGLHGQPFTLLKFRTMTDQRGPDGAPLPDADRLTPLGRFLRRTSIDELPQLINVLRGEMSVVGPRPLLLAYLPLYTPQQARRHDVRPGITGWAQVNGRQEIPFSQRLERDVWYVNRCSMWIDLKILFMTVYRVFAKKGVIPGQDVAEVDDLGLSNDKRLMKKV